MTDLGILSDPTPSERALSALRTACDAIGLAWPPSDDMALAIVMAEARSATMARSAAADPDKMRRCNHVSLACYWTLSAILAARRHDAATEARHAKRALEEHLSWIGERHV